MNQHDLTLAYTPGVAAACDAIVADPSSAARFTSRANLVAVITNGTAVPGLGAIGALAAKPVTEGKAVLFKKFAGVDVFDIEIAEADPLKLIEIIAVLEPTFGGINLEDIRAPDCFVVLAAEEMVRSGVTPKVALLSHSSFGSSNLASPSRMRQALELIHARAPWLEVDGEMQGNLALDDAARLLAMSDSAFCGQANLLVFPNLDAANIAYNLLKTVAEGGIAIGPILLGATRPVHILTPASTVRRILNMTALTVAGCDVIPSTATT